MWGKGTIKIPKDVYFSMTMPIQFYLLEKHKTSQRRMTLSPCIKITENLSVY